MNAHRERSKEQMSELRELLCDWDPIGVMANPDWPRDEYDCLIGPLLQRLSQGASAVEIADYLRDEITEHFGLNEADYQFASIAERIAFWFRDYCADA